MAIDNITQLNRAYTGAASGTVSPKPAARQELPAGGQSVPAPASGDVQQAVSRLNDYVQNLRRDLQFRVDESSDRVVVTVVDSESGHVIRQIPSEEMLAVAQSLEQMQGLLVNEKV